MRLLFLHRGLRLIFIANLVSMIGTGMNTPAVTWFILQATHSEMSLNTLVVLQTVPALLMLPFTRVIIDREDRRHPVMLLAELCARVRGSLSRATSHRTLPGMHGRGISTNFAKDFTISGTSAISCCSEFPGRFSSAGCWRKASPQPR